MLLQKNRCYTGFFVWNALFDCVNHYLGKRLAMTIFLEITALLAVANNGNFFTHTLFHNCRLDGCTRNQWHTHRRLCPTINKENLVKNYLVPFLGVTELLDNKRLSGSHLVLFAPCLYYCEIHNSNIVHEIQ